ncbi:VWA domain-containing protein [Halococcus saccharolyticus]|uniref:VWA containing CoxE-like protein n=1 Tax=Halococcus saccharolyticus DSM 5350 TaxID=1227455 RepID=M0MNV1_9EURY|nr:VWA domain-containing protein [Halococcus saccharolyticus]EMA47341.1 VWA containing CoxE-like protein [Halococcus saccharolyticus DSM 5350]
MADEPRDDEFGIPGDGPATERIGPFEANGSGVPDFVAARDHVRDELVRFVRALRRAGADVPANAATTAARALVVVGFDDRDRVRTALQACLVTDRADRTTFDDLFDEFWRRLTAGLDSGGPAERADDGPDGGFAPLDASPASENAEETEVSAEENDETEDTGSGRERWDHGAVVGRGENAADNEEATTASYSPSGRRTSVSVPGIANAKLDETFRELTGALAELAGRRWGRGDDTPDVRRALRASVGTGGTVVDVPERERRRTAVQACLLVDVSRSVLDVLDRSFLIGFLRRATAEWRDVRVFFFDEDLREVTESFDARSSQAALDALDRGEAEWGGGTKIGESLAQLRTSSPEAVSRESAVFVLSDGLEMDDVDTLEREAAQLSRRAGAVFWLNPLAASREYEPTARGMAAALPYVDGLFAFAGPDDLAEIARQLDRRGQHGRIGYEYDPRRTESNQHSTIHPTS